MKTSTSTKITRRCRTCVLVANTRTFLFTLALQVRLLKLARRPRVPEPTPVVTSGVIQAGGC